MTTPTQAQIEAAALVDRLRKMATCVYLATEKGPADDLSDGLTKAASMIVALIAQVSEQSHDWVPSTLGHGETMCSRCHITNREAAVLGKLNHCDAAAQVAEQFEAGPDECDTGVALTKAIDAVLAEDAPLVNHTIERCAQVADQMVECNYLAIAAAIRKLKDEPK